MARVPPVDVLVAADFGDASATAVWVAASIVRRFNARLRVLHAESFDAPPYFTPGQVAQLEREHLLARSRAAAFVREFAVRQGALEPEVTIADGPPADVILDASVSSDLTLLGTHGYRGARRWWLGSVAERVVTHARTPVLVVHARPDRRVAWAPASLVAVGLEQPRSASAWLDAIGTMWEAPITRVPSLDDVRGALSASALVVVAIQSATQGAARRPGVSATLTGGESAVLFVPDTTL